MKLLLYLKKLLLNGWYWEHNDVSPKYIGMKWYQLIKPTMPQIIITIISGFAVLQWLPTGFNNDFIGYINATLAILVGLYLTLIISIFDKFNPDEFKQKNVTTPQEDDLILKKNYYLQFTSLTTYSIVLAIFCILLLSISLLSENLHINISYNNLQESWHQKEYYSLMKDCLILLYRGIIIYFLLDILYISTYTITSVYSYIVGEYDKIKIKK